MRNKKTTFFVILLLGFSLLRINAQNVITTAGGNGSSSTGSMSYTVGPMVFKSSSDSGGSASQGVQQPFEISNVLGLEEVQGININLYAYPNPTTEFITLKVGNDEKNELSYHIFDITGRLLMNEKVLENETHIQVNTFVSATYYLKVFKKNKEVRTFKIIKN